MNTSNRRIGFIGGGQMARALSQGFVSAGLAAPELLQVFDVSADAAEQFLSGIGGGQIADSNASLVAESEIIFLAVKPQFMPVVLEEIASEASASKLVVSIAAGITLATLQASLGSARVIRVMPNTPCLVGAGAAAFARGEHAGDEDAGTVSELLAALGVVVETAESLLDAVTGLSGSGPAYIYTAIDALSDGGVRCGLPRDIATRLAAQTVLGAAKMVLETGEHPGVLKDRVASPGGTTIAGLAALEAAGFRNALIEAVYDATERSKELGE